MKIWERGFDPDLCVEKGMFCIGKGAYLSHIYHVDLFSRGKKVKGMKANHASAFLRAQTAHASPPKMQCSALFHYKPFYADFNFSNAGGYGIFFFSLLQTPTFDPQPLPGYHGD